MTGFEGTVAAARARSMVDQGVYGLGCGGWVSGKNPDVPWDSQKRVDCSRFAAIWCHQLPTVIEGFNEGPHSTCSGDLGTDSIWEDAYYHQQYFYFPAVPLSGDLLVYRSIYWTDKGGVNDEGRGVRKWVGHMGEVVDVTKWNGWLKSLMVVQCHGPQGCSPSISLTDGSVWDHHNVTWESDKFPLRAARVIRPKYDEIAKL